MLGASFPEILITSNSVSYLKSTAKINDVQISIWISHNMVNAHNLLPAPFEINEMQRFKMSGYRWTFDIYIKFCVYFKHVCTGKPSYYRYTWCLLSLVRCDISNRHMN